MSLTNYGENLFLDAVFGSGAPATLYFGLSTTDPGEAGTLTNEPTSTGSYARVSKTNNATNFPAASGGVKSNGTAVTFPTSTAAWSSGATPLAYWFVADAATLGAGNVLAYGALTVSRTVNASGVTLEGAISAFTFTAD